MLPLLLAALVTAAPESSLEKGARAVEELRPDEAVRFLEVAQTEGPWSHTQHVRLYEQLGIAYAYLGKAKEARAAFERLLMLSPRHALRYTLSPKVTFLFENARDALKEREPPTLDVSFPRDAQPADPLPLTLETVVDPMGFLRNVEVHFRLKGEPAFATLQVSLPPAGTFVRLELPGVPREQDVVREFFAVVKDERGNEVLELGSARFPREITSRYVAPVRWYQRWWVWVLAGAAVAAGVGVGVFAATRPLPDVIPLNVTTSP